MNAPVTRRFENDRIALRSRLVVIESLVFLLPAMTIGYVYFQRQDTFDTTQVLIFLGGLTLVLGGLIILRQFFDRILMVQQIIKRAEAGDYSDDEMKKETGELYEITMSFNSLMHKFEQSNRELQDRVLELLAIRELTEMAGKSLNLERLLTLLLEKALAVSGARSGAVYTIDEQSEVVWNVSDRGDIAPFCRGESVDIRRTPLKRILKERKAFCFEVTPDAERNARDGENGTAEFEPETALCLPVFGRDRLVALLVLTPWAAGEAGGHGEQILSIMIGGIGFAVENAVLHRNLERHSQSLQHRTEALSRLNDQLQQAVAQKERAEAEIQKANRELEQRVDERTADLARAKSQAEAASRAKSRFLAAMSHEMLTPLNAVIGFAQVLAAGGHGRLNEAQNRHVANIKDSGSRLLDLINGVLELSRLDAESVQIVPENFDPGGELRMIAEEVVKSAGRQNVSLHFDFRHKTAVIRADREKFRQAVRHLVQNAVKFMPDGGAVSIRTDNWDSEDAVEKTDAVKISISDTGIGIDPQDQERIFSVFEQGDASNRRHFDGAGMGLAVAGKLAASHGGRIWASSPGKGKGSTFNLIMPAPGGWEGSLRHAQADSR